MVTQNVKPTVAFFGATGGCSGTALAHTLKAGYIVHALARTPAKLTSLLHDKHGVLTSSLDTHLTIVQGSVSDSQAVRETLSINGSIADIIIFGIGAYPKFNWSLVTPLSMDNPHICASAMRAVVDAASDVASGEKRPFTLAVSTTGISRKRRDLPLMMSLLYHWFLSIPHADKLEMEDILRDAFTKSPGQGKRPFSTAIVVRPSLLTDGPAKGRDAVNVGWEGFASNEQNDKGPAIGYTISRADVGAWIFEQVIHNDKRAEWGGKAVTLTY
ncbi:MAG: hypothetical protein M1820_010119 [Bogoriella megaspora]|nr:MAG: hypothetical protein M1820_010119 [Bogoriella megaspora]